MVARAMNRQQSASAVPPFGVPSMVPTLNGTGFMFEVLDDYARDWIRCAGAGSGTVLDLGCAYGVATLPALAAGARVVASDMEPRHLEILAAKVPPALRGQLSCIAGALPGLDFPDGSFTAILCSRVLHFLAGEDIDISVAKMARWLVPGGRLYLVADTPYGIWRKAIPAFEAGKRASVRWPGIIAGLHDYLPTAGVKKHIDKPPFMNLLDAELLARTCTEAGLRVERASFIDRTDFRGLGRLDGRENAGAMAVKG